jgi:hypothetical protein
VSSTAISGRSLMSLHHQIHFPGLLLRRNDYQPSFCFPWSRPNLPVWQKQEKTSRRTTGIQPIPRGQPNCAGMHESTSAGFDVGTCGIIYSWSRSFTTAQLTYRIDNPQTLPACRTFIIASTITSYLCYTSALAPVQWERPSSYMESIPPLRQLVGCACNLAAMCCVHHATFM